MNRNRTLQKGIFVLFLAITALPLIYATKNHSIEKRQIGVLARTGALPSGKRSVEVLARNGELPPLIGARKDEPNDQTLDLLIHELQNAENLSRLRVQALVERFLEEKEMEEISPDFDKRSVSALARNGELPQKRTGYLIKPSQETVQPTRDLLDPDDFLAGILSSDMGDYLDGRNFPIKRSIGFARNYLLWRKGYANRHPKRSLASLARDGGLTSIKVPMSRTQRWDDAVDVHDEDKKNVGATKNFGKREIKDNCMDFLKHEKNFGKRSKREAQEEFEMPFYQNLDEPAYEDFPEDVYRSEGAIEKRFLGRIPQLGRMHQKVQSPSSRRRPHLRPNWL